jgi:hypothetical protein
VPRNTTRSRGGRFQPGPDPRRHVFTREQRQKGFATTFGLVVAGKLSQRWLAARVKATCGKHARY